MDIWNTSCNYRLKTYMLLHSKKHNHKTNEDYGTKNQK